MIPTDVIGVLLLAAGMAIILLVCLLIDNDGSHQHEVPDDWFDQIHEWTQELPVVMARHNEVAR